MDLTRRVALASVLLCSPALGQVVEEFDSLGFIAGEQPILVGNTVIAPAGPDLFATDVSRRGGRTVRAARRPEDRAGEIATSRVLVWWAENGVWAKWFRGMDFTAPPVKLADSTIGPIAANESLLFLRALLEDVPCIVTIDITDLEGEREEPRFVTEFRTRPNYGRTSAASETYFAWIDRESRSEHWEIRVRRVDALYDPEERDRIVETNLLESFYAGGIQIALFESVLVFVGRGAAGFGIYMLDLDLEGDSAPRPVATRDWDVNFIYLHPALSEHYLIWEELTPESTEMHGVRLENGVPVSEPFQFGLEAGAGTRAVIDRNLVAWNGTARVTVPELGDFIIPVVSIAELELPGADDVGDVDFDGAVTLTDALVIFNYLFLSGWRPRLRVADADGNRRLEADDAVAILHHLFLQGPRPGG
jgi:hypothetical protein